MLGQFLEFSISTGSLGPEHQFYRSLGFQELPAGDVLDAPYVALWDGAVTVGLHTAEFEGTKLTFVRPELDAGNPMSHRTGAQWPATVRYA